MNRVVDKIGRGLGYVLSAILLILMGLTLFQIISRYLFQSPDNSTEIMARILLIWLGVLSGAYCVYTKSHVGFSLLTDRLSPSWAMRLGVFVNIIIALLAISLLIYGGFNLVQLTHALDQRIPILDIPFAYVYSVLPISGLLILLFLIFPQNKDGGLTPPASALDVSNDNALEASESGL